MSDSQHAALVTRECILKLLSSTEIAKVSTAETATALVEGEEFLDLGHLDRGVQRAGPAAGVAMGHVLPRRSVEDETWTKILAELAA